MSYWQTREGQLEEAIRQGLRDAGVKGPIAFLAGSVLRSVLAAGPLDHTAALEQIKLELGVPTPDYPAPVVNAWKIADEALSR